MEDAQGSGYPEDSNFTETFHGTGGEKFWLFGISREEECKISILPPSNAGQ